MEYPRQIEQRFIDVNNTILQALQQMDIINKKLLLVFQEDKFSGVLSIGDIQKAIIANLPFEASIGKIMRKDFLFAHSQGNKQQVFKLMKEQRIECMPVLDDSGALITAYMWEDVFLQEKRHGAKLGLPVVIMAGGKGTRLKPLTNVLPKPLIPINEKTIIEHIMDKFCEVGCNDFQLSVNYKAEMIQHYLSSLDPDPGYQIQYVHEQKPLGTAGSLHLLKGKLNSTFFVTNCDIIIDQDISEIYEFHKKYKNEITIVAALKNYAVPYGVLEAGEEGKLISISEKPDLTFKINTGFYVLEPHLVDEIPVNSFYHITQLIDKLVESKRRVGVFPISEKSWKDIGDWKEYLKNIE
jgi:dTDP-glucose pyrophosphorylase